MREPILECADSSSDHWFATRAWEDLEKIHEAGTNLAILERPMRHWKALRELLSAGFTDETFLLTRGENPLAIAADLDAAFDLKSDDSLGFYEDLTMIADNFLRASRARTIGLKLERIAFDNCKHFHVDNVTLRLISTYFGCGTQWLENRSVNRLGLGQRNNSLVVKKGELIHQVPTQSIMITKGSRYAGNQWNGIVHRSPPLPQGEERLLLRIDALD